MASVAVLILTGPGAAWAQKVPAYESTGMMELTVDGKRSTYHTTSNTVPTQPGRMIHTAKWKLFPPMMLGGVNLAPPGIFVSLDARPTIQPDSTMPELKITFSLEEETHTLLESAPFEVIYTIKDGALAGEYQYAAGSLQIDSATPLEPDVLEINGSMAGILSSKPGEGGKKNAVRTLDYEAKFSVRAHRY